MDRDPSRAAPRSLVRRLAPLALLVAASALAIALGGHRLLSFETLIEHRAALAAAVADHPAIALPAFVFAYIVVVALSLPGGALMTVLGGFLFGAVLGTAASMIAATVGATVLFLIARSSLGDVLARRAGPFLARLADGFQRDGFSYLLFLRLVPAFPFWLVNLAPALLGMRLLPYVAATALGVLPGTAVFSTVGAGLDDALDRSEATLRACRATGTACTPGLSLADLVTPQLVAGLAALGVLALVPIVVRRLRRTPRPVGPA